LYGDKCFQGSESFGLEGQEKFGLPVLSSTNNEHIRCMASPMLVTDWPVVSRKSEREKR